MRLGLVRPALIGRVPGYGVFVVPHAVRRVPLEPSYRFFRGRPDPAARVRTVPAYPVVRVRDFLQFRLEILELGGGFYAGEIGAGNGSAEALSQVEALSDFDDEIPIALRLAVHAVLDGAAKQLI